MKNATMIMTVTEAKNMMLFDKKSIKKKIHTMLTYLNRNSNDKNATRKLENLRDALRITNEYIKNYNAIEKLMPRAGVESAWGG